MRIENLNISHLLSFDNLSIDLSTGLNTIVGPNSSGKTNIIRLIDLLAASLINTNVYSEPSRKAFQQSALQHLQPTTNTGKLSVKVNFSDSDQAKEYIKSYIFALYASNTYKELVRRQLNESKDTLLQRALAASRAAQTGDWITALTTGTLILVINRDPSLGSPIYFEFTHETHNYTYSLNQDRVFYNEQSASSRDNRTVMLEPFSNWDSLDNNKPYKALPFSELLPKTSTESISWAIPREDSGSVSYSWLEGMQHIPRTSGTPVSTLTFAEILTHLYTNSIVTTANLRRPPRRTYQIAHLAESLQIFDAENLPLRLLQMKIHSNYSYQKQFQEIQDSFHELTNQRFDVAASYQTDGEEALVVDVFILDQPGQVRIDFAGSGLWESLFLMSIIQPNSTKVVFLDEPGANMHPTLQRKLLALLAKTHQAIVITHTPYLVPHDNKADFRSISRFSRTGAGTQISQPRHQEIQDPRITQIHNQSETRAALFASGVLLVEGETEKGAFSKWFGEVQITGNYGTFAENNFQIISVDGDNNFGAYVKYLNLFGIPWSIICDGPVLNPKRHHSLSKQLAAHHSDPPSLEPEPQFAVWKDYWETRRVFTVATGFGPSTSTASIDEPMATKSQISHKNPKPGEIEEFFHKIDPDLWQKAQDEHPKSKVRQGWYFAADVSFGESSTELTELKDLYGKIFQALRPATV